MCQILLTICDTVQSAFDSHPTYELAIKFEIKRNSLWCIQYSGFLERLNSGDAILVAEGYMWEFDRRGYLQRGSNAPEVVLEHPDLVKAMHREFVHAGSDVVLAFTVSL